MSVGTKAEKERVGLRLEPEDAHALRILAAKTRREISEVVVDLLRADPGFRRERSSVT